MDEDRKTALELIELIGGGESSSSEIPGWARILKVVLQDMTDTWDWIIASLAEYNPVLVKEIEATCTYTEIAKMYAIKAYANS